MRPWMIVLSSAVGAIVVVAALILPQLASAARSEVVPILLMHMPALTVAALAAYGLSAMLSTIVTVVARMLRLRRGLASTPPGRALTRKYLGDAGVRHVVPGSIGFQSQGVARQARTEMGQLYYVSLARSHVFTALILLAAIAGLGLAQEHGSLPFQPIAIPTASVLMIMVGFGLVAALGRIAVAVTAEPLVEVISQSPPEGVETALLRRAVELLELSHDGRSSEDSASASPSKSLDQLIAMIEQGNRALLEASHRLSANTQALETAMQIAVEALERTAGQVAEHSFSTDDHKDPDTAIFTELRSAVEDLTGVLKGLSAAQEVEPQTTAGPLRSAPAPILARQLRQLLQEIDRAG